MRINTLFGLYRERPIYIVGSGPSLRVFPKEILNSEIVIGLNAAWKMFDWPFAFNLTVHPEHILEFEEHFKDQPHMRNRSTWITKPKGHLDKIDLDDPRYYVFHSKQEDYASIANPEKDHLFLGHGIHSTAMVLAAYMGATVIYLVGCDMCSLDNEHHGHEQHVRFHGLDPRMVYKEYRRDAAKVRKILREELETPVLTLSPFIGVGDAAEDYARLKKELQLKNLPKPPDTSAYTRKKPKL